MITYIGEVIENIEQNIYGGKSYWTNWLYNNNFNVPRSLLIKACSEKEMIKLFSTDLFNETLDRYVCESRIKKFAVRSSGISEDGFVESKAGNYQTKLNIEGIKSIKEGIIEIIKNSKCKKMGILIQEMVSAKISGVIFSSNPISGLKKEILLSYVYGIGDKLVSGDEKSVDLEINIDNYKHENFVHSKIYDLIRMSKEIENKLNFPVDLEWAIDQNDELIILQCRPITTIFSGKNVLVHINEKNVLNINSKYLQSDKIKLRLLAEKNNIKISDAYLAVLDANKKFDLDVVNIKRSEYSYGYSVVVLFPKLIEGKVMRSFIGNKNNIKNLISCYRYGVRSFPEYDDLHNCVLEYEKIVTKYYWTSAIIIQEIYNPMFTGIMKKNGEGIIIEITRGHFASKGVIPMTTYYIDSNKNILFNNEIIQTNYIDIIEGCTIDCVLEEPELVSLNKEEIVQIIDLFSPIMDDDKITIEFGILNKNSKFLPYLIDITYDVENEVLNSNQLHLGIISLGKIQGKVIKLDEKDYSDSLNFHFHNEKIFIDNKNIESIIFYAKMPNIAFLDILNKYDSTKIGFIFENGSLLCHLAVLLREKNIPAIILKEKIEINYDKEYIIDTTKDVVFKEV